jgi:hypothetical protein
MKMHQDVLSTHWDGFTGDCKRTVVKIIVVLILINILSACGSQPTPTQPPPASPTHALPTPAPPPTANEPGQLVEAKVLFGTFFTYEPTHSLQPGGSSRPVRW